MKCLYCNMPVKARGLCFLHWKRWRYSRPMEMFYLPKGVKRQPEPCLYCNNLVKIVSMQLCHMHYLRWREKRPMDLVKNGYSKPRKISLNVHGYHTITTPFNKHLVHRIIMEQHLKRSLSPDELVHHINGIKIDNRLENLELVTRQSHGKIHQRDWKVCPTCGSKQWVKESNA